MVMKKTAAAGHTQAGGSCGSSFRCGCNIAMTVAEWCVSFDNETRHGAPERRSVAGRAGPPGQPRTINDAHRRTARPAVAPYPGEVSSSHSGRAGPPGQPRMINDAHRRTARPAVAPYPGEVSSSHSGRAGSPGQPRMINDIHRRTARPAVAPYPGEVSSPHSGRAGPPGQPRTTNDAHRRTETATLGFTTRIQIRPQLG